MNRKKSLRRRQQRNRNMGLLWARIYKVSIYDDKTNESVTWKTVREKICTDLSKCSVLDSWRGIKLFVMLFHKTDFHCILFYIAWNRQCRFHWSLTVFDEAVSFTTPSFPNAISPSFSRHRFIALFFSLNVNRKRDLKAAGFTREVGALRPINYAPTSDRFLRNENVFFLAVLVCPRLILGRGRKVELMGAFYSWFRRLPASRKPNIPWLTKMLLLLISATLVVTSFAQGKGVFLKDNKYFTQLARISGFRWPKTLERQPREKGTAMHPDPGSQAWPKMQLGGHPRHAFLHY